VSSMQTLRPRCTTGNWPDSRSRVQVSRLTPSHRRASGSGMSWGGAGISRGKGNWSVDGRVRGRRCRDRAAMVGVAPRKAWTFDAVDSRAPRTGEAGGAATRHRLACGAARHGARPPGDRGVRCPATRVSKAWGSSRLCDHLLHLHVGVPSLEHGP
jgi:hypothetical protein